MPVVLTFVRKQMLRVSAIAALLLFLSVVLSAQPAVLSTVPGRNAMNVLPGASISITFSASIDPATLTGASLRVHGSMSGFHSCTISYDSVSLTATIDPVKDFLIGEIVGVMATRGIKNSAGTPMTNALGWSFTIRASRGSLAFKQSSAPSVGANAPWCLTTGDFDGDGDNDLATANISSNNVSLLLNDGNGVFVVGSKVGVGATPYFIASGDLDGDGDLDLVTPNKDANTLSILLNNGNGLFTLSSSPAVLNSPRSVTAADFDGDGDLDLASANYDANAVSVLLNNGSGAFTYSSSPAVGTNPWAITAGNFDGDGDIDLAVTNYVSGSVSILLNNGSGAFTQSGTPSLGTFPMSISAADLDGDGDLDLTTANPGSISFSVLLNNGSGVFTSSSLSGSGRQPYSVVTRDFDGDGDNDLAGANQSSGNISVMMNNGSAALTLGSTPGVGSGPRAVVPADLDGDGDLDLAASNSNSNTVSILMNIPDAPQQVVITDSSSHTISLKWRPNVEATFLRYRIYSDTVPAPAIQIDSTTDGIADTVVTYGGLLNDVRHYFRVTAVDSAGNESSYSAEVSAAPRDTTAPYQPQGLIVSDSSRNAITVRWRRNTETDVKLYRIFSSTMPRPTVQTDSATGGRTDTVKIITGLADGTRYYVRVTAVDSAGNESEYSSEVDAAPGDYIAPGPPRNLVVIDSSSRKIVLRWQANEESDFHLYRIYRGTEPHPAALVDSLASGRADTVKTFDGLVDGTRYYFRLTSVDSTGNESGFSDEVDAVPADRIPPGIPKSPAIIDSSSHTIALVWRKNADADLLLYRIYRDVQPDPVAQVDSLFRGAADTMRTFDELVNGTRYYFRITAVDSAGNESGFSAQVSATPWDRVAPAAPQQLFIADSLQHAIAIKWRRNADSDLHRYRIYRATTVHPTVCVDSTTVGSADTMKVFAGLVVGTRYYFRVTAVDSSGNESTYSNEVHAVPNTTVQFTDGAAYSPPVARMNTANNPIGRFRLKAARTGVTFASVSIQVFGTFDGVRAVKLWSSPDSIFGGDVKRDSVGYIGGSVVLRGASSSIDTAGTYYFVAVDLAVSSGSIDLRVATTIDLAMTAAVLSGAVNNAPLAAAPATITGIDAETPATPAEFSISQNYPNPFNPATVITYQVPQSCEIDLRIYDMTGREVAVLNHGVQAAGVHTVTWNGEGMASGIYLYQLRAGGQRFTKKMILLH